MAKKNEKKKNSKKSKKFLKFMLLCIAIAGILYGGIYLYAWLNPKLTINSANSYYFYDVNENLITGTDEWIGLDNMSDHLVNATIAIEDRHFFNHQGFDYPRIAKAMLENIKSGEKSQGASTITQQYARNLFLNFDKTWSRKINEAWLTIRLEVHYDKDNILEGYINTINYGGVFGVENAAKYYFNKSASELSLAEASMLAGIPNNPSEYSPFVNNDLAKKRQKNVLSSMVRDNFITQEEMDNAYNVELVYATKDDRESLNSIMYYQDAVIEELKSIKSIPASLLQTGGLKIYTNLDLKAQEAIETTMTDYIEDDSELQASGIIMDPNNGKVLALVGGVDYAKSQFNRALSTNRSVGSTIKPFLYYAALENGFTASSVFESKPTTFVFSDNQTYSPSNFADNYPNKEISMAMALAMSDNIYAVKTHIFLGEDTLVETMKRVGVSAKLDNIPSLALGSQSISLMDMMVGYSAFANEGYKIKPYFISRVEDINGNVLYEYEPVKEAILNKSITFILNELLANSTDSNFIGYAYPTGYVMLPKLTRKYAIKTGTTDYDHLVFGYNKDVVVGVWAGYDDNRLISNEETYNNKLMWSEIIEKYLEGKEESWYSIPNNVVGVLADPLTGKLATQKSEKKVILYYIKGTEPSSNYALDDVIPTIKDD